MYSIITSCFSLFSTSLFRASDKTSGSVFWFSVPLVLSDVALVNESDTNSSESTTDSKSYHAKETTKRSLESHSMTSDNTKPHKIQRVSVDGKANTNTKTLEKRKRTALVIDDSTTIRKVFERVLARLGFEVSQAENGMEGLNEMKAAVFDVVFCDFLMPIMDGLDCVKQYREWEAKHRPWFQQVSTMISTGSFSTILQIAYNCICISSDDSKLSAYQHMQIRKTLREEFSLV